MMFVFIMALCITLFFATRLASQGRRERRSRRKHVLRASPPRKPQHEALAQLSGDHARGRMYEPTSRSNSRVRIGGPSKKKLLSLHHPPPMTAADHRPHGPRAPLLPRQLHREARPAPSRPSQRNLAPVPARDLAYEGQPSPDPTSDGAREDGR